MLNPERAEIERVEIVRSWHVPYRIYGSDPKFMFKDPAGRTYIEGIDFDNGMYSGRTVKDGGRLYFCFDRLK